MAQPKQVHFDESSIQAFEIPRYVQEVAREELFYSAQDIMRFAAEFAQEEAQALQKTQELQAKEKRLRKEAEKQHRRQRIQARREARLVQRTPPNGKAVKRGRLHRCGPREATEEYRVAKAI